MRDDDKTDLPGWLGLRSLPDFTKARWLGPALSVVVIALFGMAVLVVFAVLGHALFDFGMDDVPRIGFGTGAVAVALIGAPFVIWRSVVAQKTVNVTEQGHITDRINTAVQGLGAEKVVDRIGRPITIWTGKPKTRTHQVEDPDKFALPPRAIEMRRYSGASLQGDPDLNDVFDGLHVEVKSWPDEKTMIEWQGTETSVGETEHLGKVGDWQAFAKTQPNLEVRIGAIYALERIAQDSDRDHVQIMEILCAYIRQNSPAPAEDDWPKLEMKKGEKDGPLESDWDKRLKTFRKEQSERKKTLKLREDIQTALTVIGRRSPKQRRLEAGRGVQKEFPFDSPCPRYDRFDAYLENLKRWKGSLENYHGYRLDLRSSDLRGADLAQAEFSGARFDRAYLHGADLRHARFRGASLKQAGLQSADFESSHFEGANLDEAQAQGTDLSSANFQEASLRDTKLQAVTLTEIHGGPFLRDSLYTSTALFQGADLETAWLHGAKMEDIHLENCNLLGALMQAANLVRAYLPGTIIGSGCLQGADLTDANLKDADLTQTKLQMANLTRAQLQRADLNQIGFDRDTVIANANLRSAAVMWVNLTELPQIAAHLRGMFGDASVTLPGGHGPGDEDWPEHWPEFELGRDFEKQWRKWQADPDGYRPPDPPEPESAA